MKKIYRLLVSSIILALCLNISFAQDDAPPYPPITPDNAQHLEMIQVLSKGEPRNFSWSPDGTHLAITATGGTWIHDVTDEDMPSHWVKEHNSSPHIVYAPNHDIYISYESLFDCEYLDCPHGQKIFVRNLITHEILYQIDRVLSAVVEFSPDGNLLAVATYDGKIRIWETESFLSQNSANPDDFMVCQISTIASPRNVIFSPDSSLITYSGYSPFRASPADHSLWFWDTHTCELKLEIPVLVTNQPMNVPFNANFIAYSGHYLITQFDSDEGGRGIYLWDMFTFENLGELSTLFSGSFLTFGFEGNTILFREDGIIRERDIESKVIVNEYEGDNIRYLDDGTMLINRGKKYYRLTENGEQPFIPHDIPVERFQISSNHEWLLTYHRDTNGNYEIALLWNLPETRLIKSFGSEYRNSLRGFSPDNKYLLWNGTFDTDSITLLDLETLEEKYVHEYGDDYRSEYSYARSRFYWSTSENILVIYGYGSGIWKYNGAEFEQILRQPSESNTELKAIGDDFIIFETQAGYLEFYSIQTDELVTSIHQDDCIYPAEPQSYCDILANAELVDLYATDDRQNPIARLSDDGQSLEVIDATTNEVITTYPVPMAINRRSSMWQFDDNGNLLLATKSKLYNLTTNTLLVDMPRVGTGVYACDDYECQYQPWVTWLSDNLDYLISIEMGVRIQRTAYTKLLLRVWDIQSNQEVYNLVLSRHEGADNSSYWESPIRGLSIQFAPDMRWFFEFRFDYLNSGIQATYFRDLNIYNGLTGEKVVTISTYGANAYDAQFSPDNRFLITSSDTLRVWAVVEP